MRTRSIGVVVSMVAVLVLATALPARAAITNGEFGTSPCDFTGWSRLGDANAVLDPSIDADCVARVHSQQHKGGELAQTFLADGRYLSFVVWAKTTTPNPAAQRVTVQEGTTIVFTSAQNRLEAAPGWFVLDLSDVGGVDYRGHTLTLRVIANVGGASASTTLYFDSVQVTDALTPPSHGWMWAGVNPPVLNAAPSASAGGPYSGDEGSPIALSGSASDPDGDSLSTSWTFEPLSDTDPGAACVAADPAAEATLVTCNDDGAFRAVLTAADAGHPPVRSETVLTVANVSPALSLAGPPSTPEGASTAFTYTVSDPGTNDAADVTVDCPGGAPAAGAFTCVFPNGPALASVGATASDGDGPAVSANHGLTVDNVAPTVEAAFSPDVVGCGPGNASLTATFADPATGETYAVSVDWGDGSATVGLPSSEAHTYDSGLWTAGVEVTDSDGGVGSASATVRVDYVLGGGGIQGSVAQDGSSTFRSGQPVQIRIEPQACSGVYPDDLAPQLEVVRLTPAGPVAESITDQQGGGDPTMSSSGKHYQYLLSTRSLSDPNGRYEIRITLPNGQLVPPAEFSLRTR